MHMHRLAPMFFIVMLCLLASPAHLVAQEGTPAAVEPQAGSPVAAEATPVAADYEVWAIDQSNTTADGGGTLYIYPGAALTEGVGEPEVIDLGGDTTSLCMEQTDSAPVRPHVLVFNASNTHAVLSFVATGHVVFYDAATRAPVTCIDVGEQAHAIYAAPDESYVVVANQNGKLLQRITTDYATNAFVLDDAATINLATCTTPSGAACEDAALRPDTAPIFPVVDSSSVLTFVTLRGGGLFVVDSSATPMAIVGEYDTTSIAASGLGLIEAAGKIYANSGGAAAENPIASDLYVLPLSEFSTTPNPPNTPAPAVVFSNDEGGGSDAHGMALVGDGQHLWVVDRARNVLVVVDVTSDQVVSEIDLASEFSDDPAPDMIAASPDGQWAFMSLRGPAPLTGDMPEHSNAVGSTPGVGVLQVQENGASGTFTNLAPMTNVVDGVETSDAHAIAVREV